MIFDSLWRIKFSRIRMNRFGPSPGWDYIFKTLFFKIRYILTSLLKVTIGTIYLECFLICPLLEKMERTFNALDGSGTSSGSKIEIETFLYYLSLWFIFVLKFTSTFRSALDFQLYLLTPFVLILYRHRKWAGYLSASLMVLLCWSAQIAFYSTFSQTLYGTMVGASNQAWCIQPPEFFSQEWFWLREFE